MTIDTQKPRFIFDVFLKNVIYTFSIYLYIFSDNFNHTHCIVVGYFFWGTDNFDHLKIWQNLQFTPQFVSKMRYTHLLKILFLYQNFRLN